MLPALRHRSSPPRLRRAFPSSIPGLALTQASKDQPRENSHETIAALAGGTPRANLAVVGILLAVGLWGLFFVLFRSEDLPLAMAAQLLLAGSKTSGKGLSSCGCNDRTPDRAGKESQEIIVADLTLGGTRTS